jgi:hypothetical protein
MLITILLQEESDTRIVTLVRLESANYSLMLDNRPHDFFLRAEQLYYYQLLMQLFQLQKVEAKLLSLLFVMSF